MGPCGSSPGSVPFRRRRWRISETHMAYRPKRSALAGHVRQQNDRGIQGLAGLRIRAAMKFLLDWQEAAPNAGPDERATVADLRLLVDATNACDHVMGERRELDDCITVSAYPVAEAIALNWWRIFGHRGDGFELVAHRGGYAFPDVRMRFDGSAFEVQCVPCRYDDISIWFPREARELLTRQDAEQSLSEFLDRVSDRLEGQDIERSGLQLRRARIAASQADPDEIAFCEAAGALCLDPYDILDSDADFIETAGRFFQGEALAEFLSGLQGQRSTSLFEWIQAAERRPRYKSRLPAAASIRDGLQRTPQSRPRLGERPWARGYRCARAARKALGLPETERVRSVGRLAARLGAPSFSAAPPSVPGLHALVRSDEGGVSVHLRRSNTRYGGSERQLFAFGRALGEAVAYPPSGRSVVNDLRDAARQAAGRAFAAEFLAPVAEVANMRADNQDIDFIAEEFGVSGQVIERQIENRSNIEHACAA